MTGEIHGLKAALEAQSQYMASLSTRDWFGSAYAPNYLDSRTADSCNSLSGTSLWAEADVLNKILTHITTLQAKSQAELRYAKVETTWDKLNAKDLETICQLERMILLPILGTRSLYHAANRIGKRGGWEAMSRLKTGRALAESESAYPQDTEREQWNLILGQLCGPAQRLQEAMIIGLDESLYDLGLGKRPVPPDVEANGLHYSPMDGDLVARLERMIQQYLAERENPLKEWCTSKGLDNSSQQNDATQPDYPLYQQHLSQLYLVLNVSFFVLSFTIVQ